MAHKVDLGRCLLHKTASRLQLHLIANATFTQQDCSSDIATPVSLTEQPDYVFTWIREAPELELRLLVHLDPKLQATGSELILTLKEKIYGSFVRTKIIFLCSTGLLLTYLE